VQAVKLLVASSPSAAIATKALRMCGGPLGVWSVGRRAADPQGGSQHTS
jgi:hypothetical protein